MGSRPCALPKPGDDSSSYVKKVTDDTQLTDQDRIALLTSCIDTDYFEVASDMLHNHPHLAVLRDTKKETALHALSRKPLKPVENQLSLWHKYKFQSGGRG